MQVTIDNQYNNNLEKQLIKLFHSSDLPLYFNKTGNKEFTNYQRVSIIILFERSKKSIRDFIDEFYESKWVSWLGLKKIPKKSTLHDWLKIFKLKWIRKIGKVLLPKKVKLGVVDGTGVDSWQRSRHYEKRVGEVSIQYMPYAKIDLFADVETKKIIDFSIVCRRQHDIIATENMMKRNKLKEMIILGDGGFDCERLHELIRDKGGKLFAPVRKRNKRSLKQRPKGKYRRECLILPEFMGQRSIIESINHSLKQKQINYLRSKKVFMKQREFGWQVICYNLRMELKNSSSSNKSNLNFFILIFRIYVFPDRAFN
jgi:hypothetical protein